MDAGGTHSKEALQRLAIQLRNSIKSFRPKPQPHRKRSRRYEHLWLLCWLLKDLGWALLCGFVAWPAALMALALQAHDVLQQWESGPLGEFVHSLATLAWLSGSSVWMTAQLLFEPAIHKSRTSPWYSGSIFTANAAHYNWGGNLMQAIDATTLMGLVVFYAWSMNGVAFPSASAICSWAQPNPTGDAIRQRRAAIDDEPGASSAEPIGASGQALIFGVMSPEVYSKIFIVPWMLKDLFWCRRSFIPAILCILLVTVLMADYLWLFKKWKNLAMLLWTFGSAVWLCNDLVMHEQEIWPLLLSILIFAVGACILCGVLIARPNSDDPREIGSKEERDPLL